VFFEITIDVFILTARKFEKLAGMKL